MKLLVTTLDNVFDSQSIVLCLNVVLQMEEGNHICRSHQLAYLTVGF